MISKGGVHALTALAASAKPSNGGYAGAGDIAQAIGALRNCPGKLLRTLSPKRLVESQKGEGAGFRLARDPATITMLEVMEPVTGAVARRAAFWAGRAAPMMRPVRFTGGGAKRAARTSASSQKRPWPT